TRFGPTGGNSLPDPPSAPIATPSAKGAVTITVPGVSDNNDGKLSYRIYRSGVAKPIAKVRAESWPWSKPTIRFADKGLPVGSRVSYRVAVNDGTVSTPRSLPTPLVTVPAARPRTYQALLRSTAPRAVNWRLDKSTTTQPDSSGNLRTGTLVGGVATGQ